MSANRRFFLSLLLVCLVLLPTAAAGEGSIGPVQQLLSFYLTGFQNFIRAGDLAYFTVNPPLENERLWRTDGTAAGTFQVATTAPRSPVPGVHYWTVQGSRLFFTGPRT